MREDGNPQTLVDVAEPKDVTIAEGKPGAVDARLKGWTVAGSDAGAAGTSPGMLTNWKEIRVEPQQSDGALSSEQPAPSPETISAEALAAWDQLATEITRATNADPDVMRKLAEQPGGANDYLVTWQKTNTAETLHAYHRFANQYPEAAIAFAKHNPELQRVIDTQAAQRKQAEQPTPTVGGGTDIKVATESTLPTTEAPRSNPATELQNMVDRFQKAVQDNPAFITTILEQATGSNADGSVRSLADLPIVDLTALLVVAEQQANNPGETTASLPLEKAAQIDQLRAYVLSDAGAVALYYPEHYRSMDATLVAAEVIDAHVTPDALASMTGTPFSALKEAVEQRREELTALGELDPRTKEALAALEQEWQAREQAFVAETKTIALVESDTSAVAEATKLPPGATITKVVREGESVTTTFKDPETGTETEIQAKEINVWATVLWVALFDTAFGANNLQKLEQSWFTNEMSPLLAQMGLDPSSLYEQFGKEKYAAMDGMIKTLNASSNGSEQANKFFADTLNNRTTFQILEQVNPTHLKKIFAAGGPQRFGSIDGGFFNFAGDNLQLDPDLVEKMYASLSDHEKERLDIGKTPAQPPTPQQTPVSQSQPQAAPTT